MGRNCSGNCEACDLVVVGKNIEENVLDAVWHNNVSTVAKVFHHNVVFYAKLAWSWIVLLHFALLVGCKIW